MSANRREFLAATLAVLATLRAPSVQGAARMQVALLGDSVFDNAAYVKPNADVPTLLRRRLAQGAVVRLARDGGRMADVPQQLSQLSARTTHLVISVGGNDALDRAGVLDATALDAADAFRALADIVDVFEDGYRRMLAAVLKAGLPTVVCTIYNGWFEDRDYQRRASAAVGALDDAIFRAATEHRLTVIDLRRVCNRAADFTHQVEPSAQGGAKIAEAIVRALGGQAPGARILA
jgi:lysophospholipase L1-like esterase